MQIVGYSYINSNGKVAMETSTWGWRGFTTNAYTLYGVYVPTLTTEYQSYYGLGAGGANSYTSPYGKKSADGKAVYWYADTVYGHESSGPSGQLNISGWTYYWVALG